MKKRRAALSSGRPVAFEEGCMNVPEALHAIATTGDGYCWYCDTKLPLHGEVAVNDGWDVQRIPGERVASIILVCPECLREKEELGEEGFLRNLSLRVCNSTC
jgi:hypothetical protein